MSNNNRENFTQKTADRIGMRVRYRCSNPNCKNITIGPNEDPANITKTGAACHIEAAAPGGPRYNPEMTEEQRISAENGIWLCNNCHAMVDHNPSTYTTDLLKKWKANAENTAALEQRGRYDAKLDDKFRDYYSQEERLFTSPQIGLSGLEGDETLESAYLEAMTETPEGLMVMLDAVEEWYNPERPSVLLLHGQPGHGKTTFCRKAVFEFIRKRRFQNARHVLWFPMNQEGFISGNEIKIPQILHARDEEESLLSLKEAGGSIIFLDAYDEVKLQLQNTKYKTYGDLYKILCRIAVRYQVHFVVTSRTNAVKDTIKKSDTDKTYEFAPLLLEQQESYCLKEDKSAKYWRNFLQKICKEPENESEEQLKDLLTLPFLFRMVVKQEYRISGSLKNQVRLYEDLFEQISGKHFGSDKIEELNRNYQQLAYDIWCNDEDTAESNDAIWEELLFSYFMKSEQKKILGFVHRSIYHYYLALFFYEQMKDKDAEEFLKLVAERKIDNDVYAFFLQIAGNKREEAANDSARRLIGKLDETEAVIVTYPKNENGNTEKSRYGRCNNIFFNAMMLCFTFDVSETFNKSDKVKRLIGKYDSSGLQLCPRNFGKVCPDRKINLSKIYLKGATLSNAILSYADLSGADLRAADLSLADLEGASLIGAYLNGADLTAAYLNSADLTGANLTGADLMGARLMGAHMNPIHLRYADLSFSILNGVDLRNVDLHRTDLRAADLSNADLRGADFTDANLSSFNNDGKELADPDESSNESHPDSDFIKTSLEGAKITVGALDHINRSQVDLSQVIWCDEDGNPVKMDNDKVLNQAD